MTDMAEHEALVALRFAALATAHEGDWLDVRRRARRLRARRAALAAVTMLAAIVVATPALGLDRLVIDWLGAEPAPERVQLEFLRLGVGAPAGMDPGVIPGSARKVTTVRLSDGPHTLWVAPTRGGGFCVQWTDLWGGCTRDRVPPPVPRTLSPDLNPFRLGVTYETDEDGTVSRLGGRLLGGGIERVSIEYENGATAEIPFVWVSSPIDAGFYLFEVPEIHRERGRRVAALVATDADGEVVARQTFRFPRAQDVWRSKRLPDGRLTMLPLNALVDRARRLIDFRAENGQRVTLWRVPRREGLPCHAFDRGMGCPPRETDHPMTASLHPGAEPVLFFAAVRDEVAAVELRYEDGTVERLEPVEGFVLHEVGSTHYRRGHRLLAAVARGHGGATLARQAFDPSNTGVYPCEKKIDIGHGVLSCP